MPPKVVAEAALPPQSVDAQARYGDYISATLVDRKVDWCCLAKPARKYMKLFPEPPALTCNAGRRRDIHKSRSLPLANNTYLYTCKYILLLGECNALLASGSDPTCRIGGVKSHIGVVFIRMIINLPSIQRYKTKRYLNLEPLSVHVARNDIASPPISYLTPRSQSGVATPSRKTGEGLVCLASASCARCQDSGQYS